MQRKSSLNSRNLTQGLVQELGLAIVNGKYPVNSSIPTERELCEAYGVSRIVVREAIKVLAAKGFLVSKMSQGTWVLSQPKWNLLDNDVLLWILDRSFCLHIYKEFCQAREAIEPTCAWYAAKRASPSMQARIEHSYHSLEAASVGYASLINAQIHLHECVLRATGNSVFSQLASFVRAALRYRYNFVSSKANGYRVPLREYKILCTAIIDGDADNARNSMRRLSTSINC